jgi:transcriptional regulator with XRE-family HTH domain
MPDPAEKADKPREQGTLGAFIRERRKRANLSLRQLAELTSLSNPYLSQIERGLHQPSVRVLKALSDALNVSAETLLTQAGLIDAIAGVDQGRKSHDAAGSPGVPDVEAAIRADARLSAEQREALISVYRSMLGPGR